MRRFATIVAISALLVCGLATVPAHADTAPPPPNAIISEGNGAAVFIGYGDDKFVALSWTPSKQYEAATMLYQVQRSDGAMLVSKTSASSLKDINLLPNTSYGYILTVYKSIKKEVTIQSGPSKGQKITRTVTKRVGRNSINVLTLPSMVVGLISPAKTPTSITLAWQAPQYTANPVTYSVIVDGNVMAYGLTTGGFQVNGLESGKTHSVTVLTENASGAAKNNADLSIALPKPTTP